MKQVTPVGTFEVYAAPDPAGCYTAVIAFGMTALGKHRTPRDIDRTVGRKFMRPSDVEHMHAAELHVMDSGLKVETMEEPGYPWFRYLDDLTLTWPTFQAMLEKHYRLTGRHAPAGWNVRSFRNWRLDWRKVGPKYAAYRAAGKYIETEAELTPALVKDRLARGAFVSFSAPVSRDAGHRVGLVGLQGNDTWLFDASFPEPSPLERVAIKSVIKARMRRSGFDILLP